MREFSVFLDVYVIFYSKLYNSEVKPEPLKDDTGEVLPTQYKMRS